MGRRNRQIVENGHVKSTEPNGNAVETSNNFVGRVTSIPIVQESVSTAHNIASKTSIGRFALSTLASLTQYANNNPPPQYIQSYYQSYLQPQIKKVDSLGCQSLDIIESKVPIIKEPSAKIIDDVKVKIDGTVQTVTHPAHVVVQAANKKFGTVVDNLEVTVDKYLPPSADDKTREVTTETQQEQMNQVKRAYGVLNVASQRITFKVNEQVQRSTSNIPKSRSDLQKLAQSNSLVQHISQQIEFVQETLRESIKIYTHAAQERLPPSARAKVESATKLFTQVTDNIQQRVTTLVGYIKSPDVPEWLKTKLWTTVDSTKKQLEQIRSEFNRSDISYAERLKHVVSNLQNELLPMLENMTTQIHVYTKTIKGKVESELNTAHNYFGINQKIKTQ